MAKRWDILRILKACAATTAHLCENLPQLSRTEAKPANNARTDYFRGMLGRLRDKWNVNTAGLILIICTFAIGGSLSGYAGRKILGLTGLEHGAWWIVAYILLITLLWPLAVLLVSIPLGQFRFFRNYLRRISRRMGLGKRSEP